MNKFDKWIKGAFPALLIHCSIGTVYCWSIFKTEIASYIGASVGSVEWAFSLAIFFLGMSAAFLGNFVEQNVKKSAFISTAFFVSGLLITALSIYLKNLIGIYIGYGVIMGIGLGIGYLTPVKTLMLWFEKNKGLATGLAVAGFGGAKAIASPALKKMLELWPNNIYRIFIVMACVYAVAMILGAILIKKPIEENHTKQSLKDFFISLSSTFKTCFTNKTFIGIWLMFYINITCGLAIISQEKQMLGLGGITAFGLIASITAIANAGGRIGWSTLGDHIKGSRSIIYTFIFISCMAITLITAYSQWWALIVPVLIIVNLGYGGGFSNCPTLLQERFGMDRISSIHGMCLSAWAFAGLSGNQLANTILTYSNMSVLLAVVGLLYFIGAFINTVVVKH
ncbi:MAG: OFA family MFS transporter [Clostridia bacterium]|nr:OFA family MFS transporter [Clostridia bacterium]